MKTIIVTVLIVTVCFFAKAQNCNGFVPNSNTLCANIAPGGQQTKCCGCLGTESQNQVFCGVSAPINKTLIALIIGGAIIGSVVLRKGSKVTA